MSSYLIAHVGHTQKHCEHITWWKPDSKGYTVCIDKAGLYTEDRARSICSDGTCIAVLKPVAEALAKSTPYYRRQDGRLNKLYDGGPHRVVPNSRDAWTALLAVRLGGCARLCGGPTPISAAKARAIYLDGLGMEGGGAGRRDDF